MKAAVVGARRARQGTGEWIARDLARAGVEVCAFVGRSEASRADARATLRERYGIRARGYPSLEELLEAEGVDLVAVCSPREAHLQQVRAALGAGCHVFCEKPFVWWEGAEDEPDALRAAVEPLLGEFAERGLQLALNCQWPFTLSAFDALHPDARSKPLRSFEMHLGPTRTGAEALIDSGSHPLSMLYALAGARPDGLSAVAIDYEDEQRTMRCSFEYRAEDAARGGEAVEVRIRLEQHPAPPRPAGYAINGASVTRRIELPDYSLSFQAQDRTHPVPDPLTAATEDFLARIRRGAPLDAEPILAGALHLQRLVSAARKAEETP